MGEKWRNTDQNHPMHFNQPRISKEELESDQKPQHSPAKIQRNYPSHGAKTPRSPHFSCEGIVAGKTNRGKGKQNRRSERERWNTGFGELEAIGSFDKQIGGVLVLGPQKTPAVELLLGFLLVLFSPRELIPHWLILRIRLYRPESMQSGWTPRDDDDGGGGGGGNGAGGGGRDSPDSLRWYFLERDGKLTKIFLLPISTFPIFTILPSAHWANKFPEKNRSPILKAHGSVPKERHINLWKCPSSCRDSRSLSPRHVLIPSFETNRCSRLNSFGLLHYEFVSKSSPPAARFTVECLLALVIWYGQHLWAFPAKPDPTYLFGSPDSKLHVYAYK